MPAIGFADAPRGDVLCYCLFEDDVDETSHRPGGAVLDAFPLAQAALDRIAVQSKLARFSGKAGQLLDLLAPQDVDAERLILVGLGKRGGKDMIAWRDGGARAVRHLIASGARALSIMCVEGGAAEALALGAGLAGWRFDTYRTTLTSEKLPSLTDICVCLPGEERARVDKMRTAACVDGVALARGLVAEPGNILYPQSFAERMETLAEEGIEVEILDADALKSMGMRAMLAVGQGSARTPCLCILRWNGAPSGSAGDADEPAPIALVGKGVTFDSGGLSIKPGASMEDMKGDMAGAAAMAGVMLALARAKVPVHVVALLGLVENMPSGAAFRPGDIIRSASGKTIEIINTDAEGRLVLCDLLYLAQERFKARTIVDIATLTGAIVAAIGQEYAGLFSNQDALADSLRAAGEAVGEPLWRMPMVPAYDRLIDSDFADMKNLSGGPGASTAAQFLGRFIEEGVSWAHLDIAGMAWRAKSDKPIDPQWATGFGVQLLMRWLSDQSQAVALSDG